MRHIISSDETLCDEETRHSEFEVSQRHIIPMDTSFLGTMCRVSSNDVFHHFKLRVSSHFITECLVTCLITWTHHDVSKWWDTLNLKYTHTHTLTRTKKKSKWQGILRQICPSLSLSPTYTHQHTDTQKGSDTILWEKSIVSLTLTEEYSSERRVLHNTQTLEKSITQYSVTPYSSLRVRVLCERRVLCH